jgi:NADP-dependent 3-hydroxy acid dehydrogenase YdfG
MISSSAIALITGAGSGVGRAAAISLAQRGWRIACLGRSRAKLEETARLCEAGERISIATVDVRQAAEVERAAADVIAAWSRIDVLVNAAGTNVPQRSLAEISAKDYHEIIDTNLHGSVHAARAVLPGMRATGSGTIVNVVSTAGRRASSLAGAAYVVSKFGQAGLTQAINAEENQHGIRACSVFPGDIDTSLLDQRPSPPSREQRASMLTVQDVVDCILLAIELPQRAVVEEIIVRPRIT